MPTRSSQDYSMSQKKQTKHSMVGTILDLTKEFLEKVEMKIDQTY